MQRATKEFLKRHTNLGKVGRPGGNRTPNLRFWRPLLCQLSYWPVSSYAQTIAYAIAGVIVAENIPPDNPYFPPSAQHRRQRQKKRASLAFFAIWSSWTELNRRPHPYQGCALPLSYMSQNTSNWSGRRESNPHHQLGRLRFYH